MKTVKEIKEFLANSHGTEKYHRVSSTPNAPITTDGVVGLAQMANCFWLLDAIISHQRNPKLDPDMQVWKLEKLACNLDSDFEFLLTGTNGDGDEPIVKQFIPYSDFPLDEITLLVMSGGPKGNRVILLPSEY